MPLREGEKLPRRQAEGLTEAMKGDRHCLWEMLAAADWALGGPWGPLSVLWLLKQSPH